MKEHREKSPIPFFLQTSLSLSYLLHNSMFKGLFGKVLKCKKEINKKKEENKGQSNFSFSLSFFLLANKDKNRMGDVPPPSLQKIYLKLNDLENV